MFSPRSYLTVALSVSAYVIPFMGRLEIILFPPPDLPVIICVAGGVVGLKALVTTRPIGTPLTLLPPFFFKMIFKWVGRVMFRKY